MLPFLADISRYSMSKFIKIHLGFRLTLNSKYKGMYSWHAISIYLKIPTFKFQNVVKRLFRQGRKHFIVADLFKTLYTKFYQNRSSIIQDVTKTFWLTFYWDMVLKPSRNMASVFQKAVYRH